MVRALLISLLALSVSARAFETDDAKNRSVMANEVFYKANTVQDYKLKPDDGAAWKTYSHLDKNADGEVSYEEFLSGAELPYPEWNGDVQRNIVYKRVDGDAQLLDVYAPRVRKYDAAPVIVYVHGGGWSGGRKELSGSVQQVFNALSDEGFACVSVMYRLVKMWNAEDPVVMRDCIVDCRDSLRFLKKHADELGIDPERIIIIGDSAGGHITQLLTLSGADDFKGDDALFAYKVDVAAGISWYGPSDFRDTQLFVTEGLEDKFKPDHWATRINKSRSFSYADADEKTRNMADEVSPVVYLNKDSAPLLHIHGDQDVVISPNHAHHLKAHADKAGAPVEIVMVKGAAHGWWNAGISPDKKTIEKMCVEFALQHGSEG